MAPRRKTRSMTGRQQDALAEPSSKSLRKKSIRDDSNVEEWVYRFLGNLAAIERDKEETQRRNMALKSTDRGESLKAARLRLRSPTPYAWSPLRHPVDSDGDEEDDALITPMSHARTRVARALSVDGPHLGQRDPTLLQKINRYIRAGIAEGKRRAKRYVRKALSFAIETGYIIPADREGKLLRVSPALIAAGGKPLVDARGSRRPRRGRGRSGRSGRSGRVQRRGSGKRKTTRARRRRTNDGGGGMKSTGGGIPDSVTAGPRRRRSENETTEIEATGELADKSSGGSRKSSARPSSSPSRRSHQRPMEDSAPTTMPGTGNSEADRKPLSARSRASSYARRSRDDDLMA